jgi:4-hydroxy-4-methyl-2-oxoglutarate aldolase
LVRPGDLVFADNDAVVIIPREKANEVYELAVTREKQENEMMDKIKQGAALTFDKFENAYKKLGLKEE